MTDGMGEKSLVHYGPKVIPLEVIATKLLGIEPFNAVPLIFGMVFLFLPFLLLGCLNLKREIKLVSLSFLPLALTFNFVVGYLWGQYTSFVGTFFLSLFIFALNTDKYRRPVYFFFVVPPYLLYATDKPENFDRKIMVYIGLYTGAALIASYYIGFAGVNVSYHHILLSLIAILCAVGRAAGRGIRKQ